MTTFPLNSPFQGTFHDLDPLIPLGSETDIAASIQLQSVHIFKAKYFPIATNLNSLHFIISTSFNVGQHVKSSKHK